MREYLLLLPIIFIFHDMEEIAGFIWFFKRNPYLFERFPKTMNPYRGLTHEGFALAVYEEFIPFFGISLLAYYFPNDILYGIWFGIFMALAGHFVIHIGHTIYNVNLKLCHRLFRFINKKIKADPAQMRPLPEATD